MNSPRPLPPPLAPPAVTIGPGASPVDVPRDAPATATPPVDRSPRARIGRLLAPLTELRTWLESAFLLINLGAGIAFFVVLVVLFSLSVGLLITLIGVPLLILTLAAGRVIGIVERFRCQLLLGRKLPGFGPPDLSGNLWQKLKKALTDGPGWGGIGYGFFMFPWGIFTFVTTVVCWSVTFGGLTYPIYGWAADIEINGDPVDGALRLLITLGAFVLGFAGLVVTPWIVRGLASANRWAITMMLSPSRSEELEHRVEELTVSRDASVDSAAAELRRIERDLHDGAQQRLVALAMDLGLAKARLEEGAEPQRVAQLVDRAHDEAKLAISELRDLVRGIHPAVLTDRGLDAALSALAARSPVPVDVQVELDRRPPPAVEAAAYFVVGEALTNVAKHSRATAAWVRVSRRAQLGGDALVVEVRDDGIGGAELHHGGGLAGLRDRVLAVEGRLRVASPPGGPTMLVAELPCES